jgi:hypothetical protein
VGSRSFGLVTRVWTAGAYQGFSLLLVSRRTRSGRPRPFSSKVGEGCRFLVEVGGVLVELDITER